MNTFLTATRQVNKRFFAEDSCAVKDDGKSKWNSWLETARTKLLGCYDPIGFVNPWLAVLDAASHIDAGHEAELMHLYGALQNVRCFHDPYGIRRSIFVRLRTRAFVKLHCENPTGSIEPEPENAKIYGKPGAMQIYWDVRKAADGRCKPTNVHDSQGIEWYELLQEPSIKDETSCAQGSRAFRQVGRNSGPWLQGHMAREFDYIVQRWLAAVSDGCITARDLESITEIVPSEIPLEANSRLQKHSGRRERTGLPCHHVKTMAAFMPMSMLTCEIAHQYAPWHPLQTSAVRRFVHILITKQFDNYPTEWKMCSVLLRPQKLEKSQELAYVVGICISILNHGFTTVADAILGKSLDFVTTVADAILGKSLDLQEDGSLSSSSESECGSSHMSSETDSSRISDISCQSINLESTPVSDSSVNTDDLPLWRPHTLPTETPLIRGILDLAEHWDVVSPTPLSCSTVTETDLTEVTDRESTDEKSSESECESDDKSESEEYLTSESSDSFRPATVDSSSSSAVSASKTTNPPRPTLNHGAIRGVYFHASKQVWVASGCFNGRQREFRFSPKIHGHEEAKQMAINKRLELLKMGAAVRTNEVRGVSFCKTKNDWIAQCGHKKVHFSVGRFGDTSKQMAIWCRKEFERTGRIHSNNDVAQHFSKNGENLK